jgi:acyl-CoA dehydrogenase family protein 9
VTTIFEGTTEIHSIYPALFALRALDKRLQASATGRLSRLTLLFKEFFRRTRWPIAFKEKIMWRAARFAKGSARRVRLMMVIGFLVHGRSLRRKEFFLRRITTLSIYLYGIITVLARLEAAQRSGRSIKSGLGFLAYFLEEARQVQKLNRHVFATRQEKLHHKIISEILSAGGSKNSPEAD